MIYLSLYDSIEGPEGVKRELGLACFCPGKRKLGHWDGNLHMRKMPKCEWDKCLKHVQSTIKQIRWHRWPEKRQITIKSKK